jgi:hypothetical protein
MGPFRIASHPRGRCAVDIITLKHPSPWPGLNPQPLGPVASTVTTTPPRQHRMMGRPTVWEPLT